MPLWKLRQEDSVLAPSQGWPAASGAKIPVLEPLLSFSFVSLSPEGKVVWLSKASESFLCGPRKGAHNMTVAQWGRTAPRQPAFWLLAFFLFCSSLIPSRYPTGNSLKVTFVVLGLNLSQVGLLEADYEIVKCKFYFYFQGYRKVGKEKERKKKRPQNIWIQKLVLATNQKDSGSVARD